ncbi:hypothetical protein Tco_0036509 [Tanacetum coccineum]
MGLRHHSPTPQVAAVVAVLSQDPKVLRCFMGCSAVAVADPPPTARHGGESCWKSRRCCGGRDSGVGGWRDEVEWLERVEK